MKKGQYGKQSSEREIPAIEPQEHGLRSGPDQATKILATVSGRACEPRPSAGLLQQLQSQQNQNIRTLCNQTIWISFFFDGTGNNMEADLYLDKHSNIVRLFRVHSPQDVIKGVYSVYIPGLGTYFPEVGDEGGGMLGLGCGKLGEKRLNFALEKFDLIIKNHLASAGSNSAKIKEINIAAFGFSRGAALARAFINLLIEQRCITSDRKLKLTQGHWPVRIRFLGLFDTVASVGRPMSLNNVYGADGTDAHSRIVSRLARLKNTAPQVLAFAEKGAAGADPAPGLHDGHDDWGGRLEVKEIVEEVWHFVAAHEIRNSFPVDSISVLRRGMVHKPSHFNEVVYPGAHSDVGGGYCPGEGGKGMSSVDSLSLIPLFHMYEKAIRHGVPLLARCAWNEVQEKDFRIDPDLIDSYNHYASKVKVTQSLGEALCEHMKLFFAWRFYVIESKMRKNEEAEKISRVDADFKKIGKEVNAELAELQRAEKLVGQDVRNLKGRGMAASFSMFGGDYSTKNVAVSGDFKKARDRQVRAKDARLRTQAKKNAIPDMSRLPAMLELYDEWLVANVRAIQAAISSPTSIGKSALERRNMLRPHYRQLLIAYESGSNKNGVGLDDKIVGFFDNYVHYSLPAFAGDATLPSDPRVVYLGGNEKYLYAAKDISPSEGDRIRSMA